MRIRKYISKILVAGILVNNLSFISNAGTLSPDTRYETFEDTSVRIDDVLEEDRVNVEVEGNTLVNYSHVKSFVASAPPSYNRNPMLESGKTYTFSCNVSDIKNGPFTGALLRIYFKGGGFITPLDIAYTEGHYKKVFTIPSDKEVDYYYIGWIRNFVVGQSAQLDNIMILEGDWTGKEMPSYFEGMKSVGEDKNLEIQYSNKNLFNPVTLNVGNTNFNYNRGYIKSYENGVFTISSNNITPNNDESYTNPRHCIVKLKPNTSYYFSYKTDGTYSLTNNTDTVEIFLAHMNINREDYKIITSVSPSGITFTTDNTGLLGVRFDINDGVSEHIFYDIQIEESEKMTSYEKYKSNKLQIDLLKPLRALPNGVKDRIIKKNGQWVIERNCGQVVLDGTNTDWVLHTNVSDSNTSHFQSIIVFAKASGNIAVDETINVVSDRLKNDTADNQWNERILESVCSNRNGRIGIRISNSKLASISPDGLNNWLSKNPIKVVYQLDTPIYEPLNIGPTLNIYKETTYIK